MRCIATLLVLTACQGDQVRTASKAVNLLPIGNMINVLTDCAGVVGDGCADDGPAINYCLATNYGRTFFFPRTRDPYTQPWLDYHMGETLVVDDGQTLLGEGAHDDGTRIGFTPKCGSEPATTPNFDAVTVADHVTIRDLAFLGDYWCTRNSHAARADPVSAPGGEFDGIVGSGGWLELQNVTVCAFGRDGLHINNADNSILSGVYSAQNYRYGFYFSGADAHINTVIGATARDNQMAGLYDYSKGNLYLNMQFDLNRFGSAITGDNAHSIFISPWFEGGSPKPGLGDHTLIIGTPGAMGTRPDWSLGASLLDTAAANGGGAIMTTELMSQPVAWSGGARTDARDDTVWGTGSPSGFQSQSQTIWYTRNLTTLGTIGFAEMDSSPGWWCLRGYGYDQAGHPNASICVADHTAATANAWATIRTWFPSGFQIGDGLFRGKLSFRVDDVPRSGSCAPGVDGVVYRDAFAAGGSLGWICTSSGWREFGTVSP